MSDCHQYIWLSMCVTVQPTSVKIFCTICAIFRTICEIFGLSARRAQVFTHYLLFLNVEYLGPCTHGKCVVYPWFLSVETIRVDRCTTQSKIFVKEKIATKGRNISQSIFNLFYKQSCNHFVLASHLH